jgi:hypothetical protein
MLKTKERKHEGLARRTSKADVEGTKVKRFMTAIYHSYLDMSRFGAVPRTATMLPEELGKVATNLRDSYSTRRIGLGLTRDSESLYSICGGAVEVHRDEGKVGYILLKHDTQDGLDKLAGEIGLPITCL